MVIAADMRGYWGDTMQWAAYTKNRVPHKSLGGRNAPIEVFLDKPVDRNNLQSFGQKRS